MRSNPTCGSPAGDAKAQLYLRLLLDHTGEPEDTFGMGRPPFCTSLSYEDPISQPQTVQYPHPELKLEKEMANLGMCTFSSIFFQHTKTSKVFRELYSLIKPYLKRELQKQQRNKLILLRPFISRMWYCSIKQSS